MIIRVRTHAGIWRVNDVTSETTIAELRQRLSTEHNANLSDDTRQPLTLKPNPKGDQDPLSLESTLQSLGLGHGDMVHLKLDESIRDMAHEVNSRVPAVECRCLLCCTGVTSEGWLVPRCRTGTSLDPFHWC